MVSFYSNYLRFVLYICSQTCISGRYLENTMYKVFFNDRAVYLSDDISRTGEMEKGVSYRFDNRRGLRNAVDNFSSRADIQSLHIFHDDLPMLMEEFKACFQLIDAGGGLVFNRKGAFLVIKRNGIWDLPKGKLEQGEDFEIAALREVQEETGLKKLVTVQPIVSTYHTYQIEGRQVLKRTQWFEMHYPGKKDPILESKEGITKYRWTNQGQTDFIMKNTFGSIVDVLKMKEVI